MAEKVKCADCGFLVLRDGGTREMLEAELEFRQTAKHGPKYESIPFCLERAANLPVEYRNNKVENPSALLEILEQDRSCESFVEWQQGFTPKEHKEMLQEAELRKWQTEREDADREWRDRKDEIERADRDSRDKEEREYRSKDRRHRVAELFITVVLVAIVSLLGQLSVIYFQQKG